MKRTQGIILVVAIIFCFSLVSAVRVGVSPANANFRDVLRGGYSERPIIVTVDSQIEVEVVTEVRGEIADWINLSRENFSVSMGNPFVLMVAVSPPADTPNGNYTGFIRVQSSPLGSGQEGAATGVVVPALDIFVTISVTDQEYIECRATNFNVASVEEGDDVVFSLDVENRGNVRLSPEIRIDIWDETSSYVVKRESYSRTEIVPTQKESLLIRIPSRDLQRGQYFVEVSAIECYDSRTLTFDILEEGALRAEGTLDRILVEPWADVGDIVPINVIFSNRGEKNLDVRFDGQITMDGKIVQLLRSEETTFVRMNENADMQFYFTPNNEGKYIISGRVFYDSKRTFENSAVLNVRGSESFIGRFGKLILYLVLILLIIYLIKKIREEKQSIYSKTRRIKR